MQISFTKLTDHQHRLTVLRDDGSTESVALETRSLLLHDLVHLAIETEAHIPDGFWGLVAGGAAMSDLRLDDHAPAGLALAETLVGPMQAVWNGRLQPERYLQRALGATPSVDAGFVERVKERLRSLTGHWKATPFRESMTVSWPLP